MEFWGIELKAGEPLKVEPGNGWVLHLSQASLGELKKGKGNETVPLFLKFGKQRLVLGTLSSENHPQLSFDLVFEKEFELSHNWKNGSVYFCGYKTLLPDSATDDEHPYFSDSEDDLPVITANGKPETKVMEAKPTSVKANSSMPESSAKPKVKLVEPSKDNKLNEDKDSVEDSEDDDFDEDSDDSDEEGSEDGMDEDDSEDDSEDEETPKKTELGKKRETESETKTPVSAKKAKLVTPQKTDGKKGGHTATPYPSKQAGKNAGSSDKPNAQAQAQKSGGQFSCKSCSKSFSSDDGLQSHTKAKHSSGK